MFTMCNDFTLELQSFYLTLSVCAITSTPKNIPKKKRTRGSMMLAIKDLIFLY